jgi:hypothetical protein
VCRGLKAGEAPLATARLRCCKLAGRGRGSAGLASGWPTTRGLEILVAAIGSAMGRLEDLLVLRQIVNPFSVTVMPAAARPRRRWTAHCTCNMAL